MRCQLTAFAILFAPLVNLPTAEAADCTAAVVANDECWVAIDQLRPTQLTYGAEEVHRRAAKIAAKSDDKQDAYLQKHPVTLLVGPGGDFYITDGHHVALAYAEVAGATAEVYAEVQDNWSDMAPADFWAKMQANKLVYLYDQNGQGPQPLSALPASLLDLKDDPYRSLAWGVRKAGGYEKTSVTYADFTWADFFRKRIGVERVIADFDAAVDDATPLAESPAASQLPGYTGPAARKATKQGTLRVAGGKW